MNKHVESLLPEGKKWKIVWHDEFDGPTLDRSKWDYRLHMLHRRHETWTDEPGAISFDGNSCVHFNMIRRDGHCYSPAIQTGENFLDRPQDKLQPHGGCWPIAELREPKFMHKFGYYECRCKLLRKKNWWSAFWLQSPVIGSSLDPCETGVEIDVLEDVKRGNIIEHNLWWGGYLFEKDSRNIGIHDVKVEESADGFHVFGLEWTPDAYLFYVDGQETWRVTAPYPISRREQFILLTTECRGYREASNSPCPDLLEGEADSFIVDYIRVFDEIKE